jgi:hypothetical protein
MEKMFMANVDPLRYQNLSMSGDRFYQNRPEGPLPTNGTVERKFLLITHTNLLFSTVFVTVVFIQFRLKPGIKPLQVKQPTLTLRHSHKLRQASGTEVNQTTFPQQNFVRWKKS